MRQANTNILKGLLDYSSRFSLPKAPPIILGSSYSGYVCDLSNGLISSTFNFGGYDFCKPDLKSVFSVFDMIYPDHLHQLLGYLASLFKLIGTEGLNAQDELKVILKMKYKGGFRWFLRISRPFVNETGKLFSYTSFVPFDHLNKNEEMSASWTGSTFSNADFQKMCGFQSNECVLTRTETKVLELSVTGLLVKGIAQKMHTSPSTVKTHFQNMRKKTDTHNKTELHNYFRRLRSGS